MDTTTSSPSSSQPKNVRNLSIKEFFATRLMRTKSFEVGASVSSTSSSPRDDSSSWFDDFRARMSKRAQARGQSANINNNNSIEETSGNDDPQQDESPLAARHRNQTARNQQYNTRSDDPTNNRPLVKDNCDQHQVRLENISESEARDGSPFSSHSSSFRTPRTNLVNRKTSKISITDRPDFDTASINTIVNRRDSRYCKSPRKTNTTYNTLKTKLTSLARWLVAHLIPFNHQLPWKLVTFIMFALLALLLGSVENQDVPLKSSNFLLGFLVGLFVALCSSLIVIASLIFHFLPRSPSQVVDQEKSPIVLADISSSQKHSRTLDTTPTPEMKIGTTDLEEDESKIGDFTQFEVLGEDLGDTQSNDTLLEDENYNGWMIEFVGDYEMRNKAEVKLKLTYVKIENRILHLCKPKNNDAETSSNPVFIQQRIYDLSKVSNFSANLLLPKNVRNKQKWIWSKKYPIKLRFEDTASQSPGEQQANNSIQLTLFAKSCREKEEWFRRFKLVVQENRLAQIHKDSKRASLQLESTSGLGDDTFSDFKWNQHILFTNSGRSGTVQTSHSSHILNEDLDLHIGEYPEDIEMSSNLSRTKSCEIIHNDDVGPSIFGPEQTDKDKFPSMGAKDDATLTKETADLFSQGIEDSRFLESIQNLSYKDYIQVVIESTKNATPTSDWFNSLIGRIFFDVFSHNYWSSWFKKKIQRKLYRIKLPYFMETLTLTNIELGTNAPQFLNVSSHSFDSFGLSIDFDMAYSGGLTMTFGTKLNLLKIKTDNSNQSLSGGGGGGNTSGNPTSTGATQWNDNSPKDSETSSEISNKESSRFTSSLEPSRGNDESSESDDSDSNSSTDSSYDEADPNEISDWEDYNAEKTRQSIVRFVDKIASSRYFQHATENRYIKKKLQDISNCPLVLVVKIESLNGILTVNVPPPQTDRIWYGFKPNPELTLKALPKMGDREVNLSHVTDWIERKLAEEFRKILVIPNMEDIVLPILKSDHLMYVASTR